MFSLKLNEPSGFFFSPAKSSIWDTWVYCHNGSFYLYYLVKHLEIMGGVGLALSHDGVHWEDRGKIIDKAADATWLGSGAVCPLVAKSGEAATFVMNFSEWRGDAEDGRQTIWFAQSEDLIHWTRLDAHEFCQDQRWYRQLGRWDNIWPVARAGGGYHGYWAATPKDGQVGLGFGESCDGIDWQARPPAILAGVPAGPPKAHAPEVGAVHSWNDRYYAVVGLDDLAPVVNDDFSQFHPGMTTFVAASAHGPFAVAPRNRRLLVGNASYFLRFVETPDAVLVNHHSWEIAKGKPFDVDDDTACLAPLKQAVWDEEGTLRLQWWRGNEIAKRTPVPITAQLIDTPFDPAEILILEGLLPLTASPSGLYLEGTHDTGTGFLLRGDGAVEYGDVESNGERFKRRGLVDRELELAGEIAFRLIRRGRITEFYVNDYLMQCYCLPERGSGRIGILGLAEGARDIKAWYCR